MKNFEQHVNRNINYSISLTKTENTDFETLKSAKPKVPRPPLRTKNRNQICNTVIELEKFSPSELEIQKFQSNGTDINLLNPMIIDRQIYPDQIHVPKQK